MRIETENFGVIESETQRRGILAEHSADLDCGAPAVYVGTYGKFNCGSLAGLWVDLTSFGDYDEFVEFCAAVLHWDEEDPELMAQDFDGFPEAYYHEGFITREDFDNILEYASLDNKEAFEAYCQIESCPTVEDFNERYVGEWESERSFAEQLAEDLYFDAVPEYIRRYFDYQALADDLFDCDYTFCDGYVFRG